MTWLIYYSWNLFKFENYYKLNLDDSLDRLRFGEGKIIVPLIDVVTIRNTRILGEME